MPLETLDTNIMVALSHVWTHPGTHAERLLSRDEHTQRTLEKLRFAHKRLLASRNWLVAPEYTKALVDLNRKRQVLEVRHDKKARGVFGLLTGFADVAENPRVEQKLLEIRSLLFPRGLRLVNRPAAVEGHAAKMTRGYLDATLRPLLTFLPSLGDRTLLDEIYAWLDAGDAIGRLERHREAVESVLHEVTRGRPVPIAHARQEWIHLVLELVEGASLSSEASGMDLHVLSPLRQVSSAARFDDTEEAPISRAA